MLWALLPLAAWAVGTRSAQGQAAPPPAASPPPATSPAPATPLAAPSPAAAPEPEFAFGSAAEQGAGESANAAAPYMIGDFFVGGGQIAVFKETSTGLVITPVGQIPSAGGTQRVKICEDNSPIPVDRVFFDYNHFENAILSSGPQPRSLDADRYTPGFEKTFWDGMASVQLRVPVAHTQNSDVFLDGTDPLDNEFGNMDVTLKFLLYRSDDFALAVGSAVNLPTAEGTRVFVTDNTAPTFTIADNAYHILPYVGALWTPDDRWFAQAFLQFDVAANGNQISQQGFGEIGSLRDQTLLYLDLSVGCWLYRDPSAAWVTGVAPVVEFHYTTTLQDAQFVQGQLPDAFEFGNVANRLDIHNLTLGAQFLLGKQSTLHVAGVIPLDSLGYDRQFDGELLVQLDRFF